jgi:CHAT domain-containing protein
LLELRAVTTDDLVGRVVGLEDPAERGAALASGLAELADADALLRRLRAEAERLWGSDPRLALRCAEALVQAARLAGRPEQVALGLMTKGDSLRFLGRYPESVGPFEEAARLFLVLGDEVGWARTCIGSLVTAHYLGRADQKLVEAERAHAVLVRQGEWLRAASLDLNAGWICFELGRYGPARRHYDRALRLYAQAAAEDPSLAQTAEVRAAKATNNKATLLTELGHTRAALRLHESARRVYLRHGELLSALGQQEDIGQLHLGQGRYARALRVLADALAEAERLGLDDEAGRMALAMAECYLRLNRPEDALELAEGAVTRFGRCGTPTEAAKARFTCAIALGQLGEVGPALELLDMAARVFESAGMVGQSAVAALQRGSLHLAAGDPPAAWREAARATDLFASRGMAVREAQARLLQARAAVGLGYDHDAERLAGAALAVARRCEVSWLAHEGHQVLARVARRRGDPARALDEYDAAIGAIERVQSRLPTELRTNFLADKLEVYHEAIECALADGRIERAFGYLERSKSRALADFLAGNPDVRPKPGGPTSQRLVDELIRLREAHNWAYNRLYGYGVTQRPDVELGQGEAARLRGLLRDQERRISRLLERLALQQADGRGDGAPHPSGREPARPRLDGRTVLLEYYLRAEGAVVFVLTDEALRVVTLPLRTADLLRSLRRWQLNLDLAARALAAGQPLGSLERNARGILALLYDALLRPVADHLAGRDRLVVIPHGALHGLPFHALHDGARYLIETHELSTCPSSDVLRLCARRRRRRLDSALVVASSDGGRLPYVLEEAAEVAAMLPGELRLEADATRAALIDAAPRHGVLHVAAHGEARLDNPAFAHLKLADGQLTTSDVFNLDLDGALVTLSACESGRSAVAGGDELIGLSRGFLYAGARALVQSLWRVDDRSTARLMGRFYRGLCRGLGAAAALRQAQLALLTTESAHPYVWAPFQLVGHGGDGAPTGPARPADAVSVAEHLPAPPDREAPPPSAQDDSRASSSPTTSSATIRSSPSLTSSSYGPAATPSKPKLPRPSTPAARTASPRLSRAVAPGWSPYPPSPGSTRPSCV